MKAILPFTLLIFLSTLLPAQIQLSRHVIASSGGYGEDPSSGISLSWTLGEIAIQTLENNDADIILTQGFQQPDEVIVTSVKEIIKELSLSIYPNPVSQTLHIQLEDVPETTIKVNLLDLNGKVIKAKLLEGDELEFQMEGLPATMYLIQFSDGKNSYTRKVLKTHP